MRDKAGDIETGRLPDVGWGEETCRHCLAEVIDHEVMASVVSVFLVSVFDGNSFSVLPWRTFPESHLVADFLWRSRFV